MYFSFLVSFFLFKTLIFFFFFLVVVFTLAKVNPTLFLCFATAGRNQRPLWLMESRISFACTNMSLLLQATQSNHCQHCRKSCCINAAPPGSAILGDPGRGGRSPPTFFLTKLQLTYNVSGVEQSDSVIHRYMCILFQVLFHHRLLQDTEYSSLCSTVGPCCLSTLYIVVYIR